MIWKSADYSNNSLVLSTAMNLVIFHLSHLGYYSRSIQNLCLSQKKCIIILRLSTFIEFILEELLMLNYINLNKLYFILRYYFN